MQMFEPQSLELAVSRLIVMAGGLWRTGNQRRRGERKRKEVDTNLERERRGSGKDGDREWIDLATSQGQLVTSRSQGRDLLTYPQTLQQKSTLLPPGFQTFEFQNWKTIHFCYFKQSSW